MKNIIYKLKFNSAVRFGPDGAQSGLATANWTCHADTFFSALCREWINVHGLEDMLEMVLEAKEGRFLLSDLFPWSGTELFLPKPVLKIKVDRDEKAIEYKTDKKQMKKISFIPVSKFDDFISFLKKGGELPFEPLEPVVEELHKKAAIVRTEKTEPYVVAAYRFKEETGLYFIVKVASPQIEDKLLPVVESLGISGIGGKKSYGYGRFCLSEEPIEFAGGEGLYDSDLKLGEMMERDTGLFMSLSVLLPGKSDLESFNKERSYYTIIPRTGFVNSPLYSRRPLKHKQVCMFGSGSCFDRAMEGQLADLSSDGGHQIFRYGKGMYLGVNL